MLNVPIVQLMRLYEEGLEDLQTAQKKKGKREEECPQYMKNSCFVKGRETGKTELWYFPRALTLLRPQKYEKKGKIQNTACASNEKVPQRKKGKKKKRGMIGWTRLQRASNFSR